MRWLGPICFIGLMTCIAAVAMAAEPGEWPAFHNGGPLAGVAGPMGGPA